MSLFVAEFLYLDWWQWLLLIAVVGGGGWYLWARKNGRA